MRLSDLAGEQGLAVSTMTRNVALLERKGWLSRASPDGDKRVALLRLTPQGVAQAQTLRGLSVGQLSRAFSGFHPSDRVERAVALDRVAAALEALEAE